MQAQRGNLIRHQPILAGVVQTDLIESAGRAPHIRLDDPMPRSIGTRLAKVDMPDREIDHRSAHSYCEVHGAGVVGQQESALGQHRSELRQRGPSDRVAERPASTGLPIGHLCGFNRLPLALRPDKDISDRCLPTQRGQGLPEEFRSPGLHRIAGPDLHRRPGHPLSAVRCKKITCPLRRARGNVERQGCKGSGTASAQGVDIYQIEVIELPLTVHIGQIGHPRVMDGHVPVFRSRDASNLFGADVGGQQSAPAIEGQIYDAVVPGLD